MVHYLQDGHRADGAAAALFKQSGVDQQYKGMIYRLL